MMKTRWITWSLINASLVAACLSYSSFTSRFDAAGIERFYLAALIGLLGLLSIFTFPNVKGRCAIGLILLVSILSRLALLPAASSDDMNRYLWEGKLVEHGVSPYQGLADDPVYESECDHYWEMMNHRDLPTAYPPLATKVFSWINQLGYHPMSYKLSFMLLDLFLIAVLLAILRHHVLPLRWVLFYALSPLSLLSYSAEGHFDILMVVAVVFSIYAISRRWFVACGVAVGVAVSTKIMAIVLAPILLWRAGMKGIGSALFTVLIPVVFFWSDTLSMLHGLFIFGSKGRFNGPVHQLLSWAFDRNYDAATLTVTALFGLCWLFGFWLMLKNRLWSALLVVFGSLLVLSPVVHFWYLTWVLPLVVLRPRASWISLSVTMCCYFLVWNSLAQDQTWSMPLWAKWAFWLPFSVCLIGENRSVLSRIRFLKKNSRGDQSVDPTFTVVIPTFNSGECLQKAVESLAKQSEQPQEVIITDAGSTDESISKLDSLGLNLRVIKTNLGRGEQITSGVKNATQEWVLVFHADAKLEENTLLTIKKAVLKNPRMVGGSLGQRFDKGSLGLLLIESMNEFRSTLLQTSFGDQNQFFHRQTAIEESILTEQPLMEDVEMSDRLNELGDTVNLAHEGVVSATKWKRGSYWKRFFTVVEFCLRYRLMTFSTKARLELSRNFYRRYYKS